MTTASPKPKHQTVAGRVRINLFGGAGAERHRPVNVLLERRRDENSEDWYPAAGFRVEELPSLEQAARAMHEHLTKPNGKVSEKATARPPEEPPTPSRPESEADDPDGATDPEDPPFTPNRPAPSSGDAASASTHQSTAPASPTPVANPTPPAPTATAKRSPKGTSRPPSRPRSTPPKTRPDPTRKSFSRKAKVRSR